MKIIVAYDVSVISDGGKKRLRRVAKQCLNYGLRVQNSVFECEVDWAEYIKLKDALLKIIDTESDSLRIYNLGNRWDGKVEHFGVVDIPDMGKDTLLL
ncbi:MAG: CRISPR-associated endonuclease Cas2 [Lentisphaeria bacterium]|nr:CRISPR-associated endonuclease Cas2 [Lentisphaeria bacterium]